MKLQEKFANLELDDPYIFMCESDAEQCEKIADEFAIGFFDWFNSKQAEDLMHDLVIVGEVDINTTTKEILEIYKKEKGL